VNPHVPGPLHEISRLLTVVGRQIKPHVHPASGGEQD
jgi:hypothetical protein